MKKDTEYSTERKPWDKRGVPKFSEESGEGKVFVDKCHDVKRSRFADEERRRTFYSQYEVGGGTVGAEAIRGLGSELRGIIAEGVEDGEEGKR